MRVRDIINRDGAQLRLSLAAGESGYGPLVRLSDPRRAAAASILLDLYGTELLASFLMSARLSAIGDLSDECCEGDYPLRMRLGARGGAVQVELDQLGERLILPRCLWDRLYAELQLTLSHGRNLARAPTAGGLAPHEQRRLLH
nr:hypothetical protein [uncultured Sphingomonas sp.]